ncbi:MAG: CPBP family intramembrane metalloprotease [Anaerolineales bacterium]|nr:CPBP family intramembrane metalloprotease [Anaerolineales bacterium]
MKTTSSSPDGQPLGDNSHRNSKRFRDKVGELLHTNKLAILGSILLVFLVGRIRYLFPDLNPLGVPLSLLAIWAICWFTRVGWSDLGMFKPTSWPKVIIIGVGTGILLQGIGILQFKLGAPLPDISSFEQVKNNFLMLLGGLLISWTTAGFGEEIIWRGFMMKQIARLFDDSKNGWWVGLILSSILFGLIHAYQGIAGIVYSGIAGIIYGFIVLKSGRNLWTAIIAHATTDTVAFILIYNWDSVSLILGI